jgi:hypothetical protein
MFRVDQAKQESHVYSSGPNDQVFRPAKLGYYQGKFWVLKIKKP